ncbi:MAG: FAD-binding oxidoreductase [Deltaproteobacteria bacterium]|jgi:D-lactate dehydrogenase (cytochrome)|nr:FAD-binding oxidoreductase [Deltaproteobacteria bacterium]
MTSKNPPPAHSPLLRDESRFQGWADDFVSPSDQRAMVELAGRSLERGQALTFQGAGTGLCGAGVPLGGLLVSTARLDKPICLNQTEEGFELWVQPGFKLSDLRSLLISKGLRSLTSVPSPEIISTFRSKAYFWPPDPGETSATLGGLAATKASGPNRLRFGTVADHISALKAVFSDGQEYAIKRGRYLFKNKELLLPTGETLGIEPAFLGLSEEADLIDLLIGSQGMFGYISGLGLSLVPAPTTVWGLVFFLDEEKKACLLIDRILDNSPSALISLDFLDRASLNIIDDLRNSADRLAELPLPPPSAAAAVLIELMADDESQIEAASEEILKLCLEVGGEADDSWALVDSEVEKMHTFRHAVPEGLGGKIDAIRTSGFQTLKTAADLTRPDLTFYQTVSEFRRDLNEMKLSAVIFGHAKNNHLHVNFLPKNADEADRAAQLLGFWLERSKSAGGLLFAEHGVGKIKKALFLDHERAETIQTLKEIKKTFDPYGLFNPGNMFD